MHSIQLTLMPQPSQMGLTYQLLHIEITSPDRLIAPQDLQGLQLPDGI
jgi:hypothetical protein